MVVVVVGLRATARVRQRERMSGGRDCSLLEHDATTARVEHDKVLQEHGCALRFARHRLPRTDDAALEVL